MTNEHADFGRGNRYTFYDPKDFQTPLGTLESDDDDDARGYCRSVLQREVSETLILAVSTHGSRWWVLEDGRTHFGA